MIEFLLGVIAALFAAIAYFTKKIMDDTSGLRTEMRPIPPAIVEIQGKFTEAGHTLLFPLTVAPGSPLKLTEYGQKLVDDSGFEKILADCREMLVQKVKDTHPTTNYDIQQNSIDVIRDLLDSDDDKLKPLKSYAFNNGLSVDILIPPAGIVLRDEVMKELTFPDEE
jgi:hypothetical protein